MQLGQVYFCEGCGLELQVVKECDECGEEAAECACEEHCTFSCCGEEMKLRA
jgi:hypothetical protein